MKTVFFKLILIFPLILILSCKSSDLMKRRYLQGYYFSHSGKSALPKSVDVENHIIISHRSNNAIASLGVVPTLSTNVKMEHLVYSSPSIREPRVSTSHSSQLSLKIQRAENKNSTAIIEAENRNFRNEFSNRSTEQTLAVKKAPLDEEGMFILLLILSLIVPPLAIYLKNNKTNQWFWISLICCLFAGGIFFNVGFLGTAWIAAFLIALLYVLEIIS